MAGANVSLFRVLLSTAAPVNTLTRVENAPQVSVGVPCDARFSLLWLLPGASAPYRVAVQIHSKF